jgi:DegV family protein with EDD domain
MSKIAVVTDSTAYLPPKLVAQYGIRVIPLELIWGDETFLDGVAIDPPTFYERLSCSPDIPSTTQPSAGAFTDFFTDVAQDADGIVGVFISSELSGTIASALVARDSLPDLPIEVIDSRSTSMGLGFMVLAAARAAAEGKGLEEVAAAARALVPCMDVVFVVETLKYLHKGGRIGGASHLLGSALNIKPLLYLNEGHIEALERVRTKRKAVARMLDVMAERAGEKPIHAAVIHANAPDEGARLQKQVSERFPHVELYQSELSPVIGTHVGPGTVGVAFYTDGQGSGTHV